MPGLHLRCVLGAVHLPGELLELVDLGPQSGSVGPGQGDRVCITWCPRGT